MRFRFGDHLLDPERRELHRGSEPVALEPQVFDLLVHLVSNRDHVVSKDALIEHVWGGRIVSDATIDSRVKAARQAVGDSGAIQLMIRTMPRKGVRFVGAVIEDSGAVQPQGPAQTDQVPPALALPDRPSIAVLPFTNMSSDREQEFFSDGIAEDIITLLSKSQGLFVIARNSSFTYKGRAIDLKIVGQELGVRYVLEGSVRKAGDRVRVTAQLIETATASHIWAERLDRELADVFAVQNEITANVSAAILPAMERSERERAARKAPDCLDAWECYHRGLWHYARLEARENERARSFFHRAIELDPGFSAACSAIAVTYFTEATTFRAFDQRSQTVPSAVEFARRSLSLDASDARGHSVLAYTLVLLARHEEAMAEADLAVALDRNSARALGAQGYARAFGGRPHDGIESLRMALRRSPFDPLVSRWQHHMARALYFAGDYLAAIALARQVCHTHPNFRAVYRTLVAALGQAGQAIEAQAVFSEALERFGASLWPPFGTRMPELRQPDYDHMIDGYRKAGVLG